jgi:hypothetical protein
MVEMYPVFEFLLAARIYYVAAFPQCRIPEKSLNKHQCVPQSRQRGAPFSKLEAMEKLLQSDTSVRNS